MKQNPSSGHKKHLQMTKTFRADMEQALIVAQLKALRVDRERRELDGQFQMNVLRDELEGGDEMTYDEHLEFLIRQERGARAERQGFLDAKSFKDWTKPVTFTKDEREQQRYNLGWENGKTMLKCDAAKEVV